MWDAADIAEAVDDHPQVAADALGAVMLDSTLPRLEAAGLTAAAQAFGRDIGEFWVEQLEARQELPSFARALATRGVAIDFGAVNLAATNIPPDKLSRFTGQATAFRCRIRRDGEIVGSGTLIGPTAVLTAWHVIARAGPNQPQEPWPKIEVELADGRRLPAVMPALFASPSTPDEYGSRLPSNDAGFDDANDVAVIRLSRPAGALLGAAALPPQPAHYVPSATVLVVHYPDGQDPGIGIGSMAKIRGLTVRWAHSVGARPGSSGGGCFDSSLTLAGIHQGKDPRGRGRLVPSARFLEKVREIAANDQAPPRMWSLDGTPDGDFVIGRQAFFEAYALARGNGRVRGIRIKRADAAGDLGGLSFSFRMLEQMTARSPQTLLCRISFEALIPDLADDIVRRAVSAGVEVPPIPEAQGVAHGQTAPEAVGADRGRRAATALDARAAELDIQLWFFIDHPAIAFGDSMRAALEGFIDQALRLPRLRIAIAGFEAVALPGLEFQAPPNPPDIGAPGLMADVITGFGASDVRLFLADAAAAASHPLDAAVIDQRVTDALAGIDNVNGIYEPWRAAAVAERLRPVVRDFFKSAP
jgi:hypothetical protein